MKSASTTAADTVNITMESLALPQDLYWDGKVEPTSPAHNELFTNVLWFQDDNCDLIKIKDDDFDLKSTVEFPHEVLIGEKIYDLEDGWSDNKLPLLLGVDAAISHPNSVTKVGNIYEIGTQESENFDTAVLTSLTPPQSPPQTTPPIFLQNILHTEGVVNFNDVLQSSLVPQSQCASSVVTPLSSAPVSPALDTTSTLATPAAQNLNFSPFCGAIVRGNSHLAQAEATHDDDVARNSQIVDEFLRSCVKELPNLNEDCESMSSYSLPSSAESIITDEEWLPDSSVSSASSSPSHSGNDENAHNAQTATAIKKRTRPYGRGVEDRKIRKKEQNKNAATRYRQKKKLEMEIVLSEEQELLKKNEELKRTLAERQREAKYLRTLIREFYKNKK